MTAIGSTAKVIAEITALIVAGLALAEALEKMSKKTGIGKKQLRKLWREYGPA